jgi:hypothetical protein
MTKFGECKAGRTPCEECGATSTIFVDAVHLCDDCNIARTTEARRQLAESIEKMAENLGDSNAL